MAGNGPRFILQSTHLSGDSRDSEPPPMTIFQFILGCLATYRIALLFSKEYGPFGVFEELRKVPPKKSDTAKWLSCLWCFSITASAFVCGLFWFVGVREHWAMWLILWLSFSAGAICLNQIFTRGPA